MKLAKQIGTIASVISIIAWVRTLVMFMSTLTAKVNLVLENQEVIKQEFTINETDHKAIFATLNWRQPYIAFIISKFNLN